MPYEMMWGTPPTQSESVNRAIPVPSRPSTGNDFPVERWEDWVISAILSKTSFPYALTVVVVLAISCVVALCSSTLPK